MKSAEALSPAPTPGTSSSTAGAVREDQLDRIKRLGVVPSFFVVHTYFWGDRHRDIFLGPDRQRQPAPQRH